MKRLLLTILIASAAFAQNKPELRYFYNGVGIALHTESSAARSPLSMSGSITGGPVSHRVVLDSEDNPIFAYDLEIAKSRDVTGVVLLKIRPIDQQKARTEGWGFPKDKLKGDIPTLSAAREFPPLKIGDQVQVDILYNPSTGEKLWDVLRFVTEQPFQSSAAAGKGERFSFERVAVKIDGKIVADERDTWMIGQAIKMGIPGHGDYYMVLTPPTDFPFQASGWVDHNVLRFGAGGEQIEITGKSNLLQRSDYGTVWVYFESPAKPLADNPEIQKLVQKGITISGRGVNFSCADNMDQLYPKDRRKRE